MAISFKGAHFPQEIILMSVRWYLAYPLSTRHVEELMEERGVELDHATINRWVIKYSPLLEEVLHRRKRPVWVSWRMDETYIKINGKWVYLYRAVDSCGNTIEFLLRKYRDAVAAKAFFRKAFKNNSIPDKVTIDKSGSNTCALNSFNEDLPEKQKIEIRQNKYLNNIIEQDHRFIKKRTKPMLGFKSFRSAKITIAGIENIRIIQKGQIIGSNNNASTFEHFKMLMAS